MGEVSKYFVPEDDARWLSKERELAEAFWTVGLFVTTQDRFIYRRIEEWRAAGRTLPASPHQFSFAEMGLASSPLCDAVPNAIYDLACPECQAPISDVALEVWEDEASLVPLPLREVTCPTCQAISKSQSLASSEAFTFARVYLWVSDIDTDDWDSSFKRTVEGVLGTCQEFTSWET